MSITSSNEFFKQIKNNPGDFYLIHYSCQSLYDDCGGLSPRITSIAVTHFATEQTLAFLLTAVAEELGIARDDVQKRFNEHRVQTFK